MPGLSKLTSSMATMLTKPYAIQCRKRKLYDERILFWLILLLVFYFDFAIGARRREARMAA